MQGGPPGTLDEEAVDEQFAAGVQEDGGGHVGASVLAGWGDEVAFSNTRNDTGKPGKSGQLQVPVKQHAMASVPG